jgi:hypothetical protein
VNLGPWKSRLAAWACYVDPDEGYNRFQTYGWASWHVWQPLVVTFAIIAVILAALWLYLRPWSQKVRIDVTRKDDRCGSH